MSDPPGRNFQETEEAFRALDHKDPGKPARTSMQPSLEYKDQVRSHPVIQPKQGGTKVETEGESLEFKDQVRQNDENKRNIKSARPQLSSSTENVNHAVSLELCAEAVDTDLERNRLRREILREIHGQSAITAQPLEQQCMSSRAKKLIAFALFLLVTVAVVVGILVGLEILPTSQPEATPINTTPVPVTTFPPISTPIPSQWPSMGPTFPFWSQLGGDIAGRSTGRRIGDSVALSKDGRIVAVSGQGTSFQDGANGIGRIRVFELSTNDANGEIWSQKGRDIEIDFRPNPTFGRSISMSSDGLIVAAGEHLGGNQVQGQVRVFRFNADVGAWEPFGQDLFGNTGGNQPWFGFSVSLSDDGFSLAIGAPIDNGAGNNAGRLRVFGYNSTIRMWEQMGTDIVPSQINGQLGISVSLSGNGLRLAAGAYFTQPPLLTFLAGRVSVYELQNGDWAQIGQNIDGENEDDRLGWSVSLSENGNTLACSDLLHDNENGMDAGRVRVFELRDSSWTLVGQPVLGGSPGDGFGSAVALSDDGTMLAAGAAQIGDGSRAGYIQVLQYDGSDWIPTAPNLEGINQGDRFGTSVALSAMGTIVAAGSPFHGGNGSSSGLVRVFRTTT